MLRTVVVGLIVASTACGSARVVQRTQVGGTIELSGDRGTAMDRANDQMASHCGANNYTIVMEGDEPTNADPSQHDDLGSGSATGHTAWRVHYQCNGAVATPPPSAPAPAPAAAAAGSGH